LIQTLLNSTGPASVLNFHLPNLIMRYVVGGGATNYPWLFPLTHSKLSVVVRKASEDTMQEQALDHIVFTSLDRSPSCGVERCLYKVLYYQRCGCHPLSTTQLL
jgi:hypothetical protein